MPSETGELKAVRPKPTATLSGSTTTPPPPNSENLPCPRCDSTSTKFCYYNNYNLAQPRHFCKSCRRYWTQGGTLRNIPIGGGKNSKRSRTTSMIINNNKNTYSSSSCSTSNAAANARTTPTTTTTLTDDMHVVYNDNNVRVSESFMSLLSYGGGGFEEMGSFGFGKGSTWQMNGGVEGGLFLDCFAWPELALPNPGNVLK